MADGKDSKPTCKQIGQNYTLPDLVAKVTGRAKDSEDIRAEGMLFARLLLSPMPHARIERIDASAALAMPGGDDYLRRTPATPSMIVASIDAGRRIDEGFVSHV